MRTWDGEPVDDLGRDWSEQMQDALQAQWELEDAQDAIARTAAVPHRGDPIELYDDRMTVLDLIDRGMGLLIVAEDDAGSRIERYADPLTWDDDARAWRAVA